MSLPQDVRAAAARVASAADYVFVDLDEIEPLTATLVAERPPLLAEEQASATDEAEVVATVVGWNAVNFGSGWHPTLRKDPHSSGSRTLNGRWNAWCAANGAPTADRLASIETSYVADIFGQDESSPAGELMAAFATAWRELGTMLLDSFDGSFVRLVEGAHRSAAALAEALAALPSYADVSPHPTGPVPLYKRAQITASHLASALDGRGLGRFDDLDQLTCFADNLVPAVLIHHGVLAVESDLDARIRRGELLTPGEQGEVELRAVGVHAVELLAAEVGATAASIDHQLWQAGQDPAVKVRPRHRCRCTFY